MVRIEDISDMLPINAYLKGFSLEWEKRVLDPVYLYDRAGQTIHVWDYVPSLGEVDEVCQALEEVNND